MDADLKAAGERHDDEHLCTGRVGGPDTDTIYEGDCDAARFRDALAAAEAREKALRDWVEAALNEQADWETGHRLLAAHDARRQP